MRGAREQLIAAVLRTSPPEPADAIIVLCGEDMKPRADVAFAIFKRQYAKTIVLTGGKHEPPRIENAEAALAYLVGLGVAVDRIIVDRSAMNTRDQAVNVVEMATAYEWKTLLLVASEYHLPRATLTFVQALMEAEVDETIRLIPITTSHTDWTQPPEGMTESRLALLTSDADKAEAYSLHVASFVDGLEYLEQWEKP